MCSMWTTHEVQARPLYTLACQLDLEGIVAKRANSRYEDNAKGRNWIKIKNPKYSEKEARGDLSGY